MVERIRKKVQVFCLVVVNWFNDSLDAVTTEEPRSFCLAIYLIVEEEHVCDSARR